MADIINSSDKDKGKLINYFKKIRNKINVKYENKIISPLTITLGDEFQGLINSLYDAICIIIDIEEMIIKDGEEMQENNSNLKLRYILHYGLIETDLNRINSHEMLGEGLTNSRNLLNKMKKDKERFKIYLPNDFNLQKKLNNTFINYQKITDGEWKIKDYKFIYEFINDIDYKVVAKKYNKNISYMWRKKTNSNIKEYLALRELILLIAKEGNVIKNYQSALEEILCLVKKEQLKSKCSNNIDVLLSKYNLAHNENLLH